MSKLPQIKPRELEALLLKNGFRFVRQKGSHKLYEKDAYKVTVPFHNKPLKKGTLNNILKQVNISRNSL